jgi:hypothetical protein
MHQKTNKRDFLFNSVVLFGSKNIAKIGEKTHSFKESSLTRYCFFSSKPPTMSTPLFFGGGGGDVYFFYLSHLFFVTQERYDVHEKTKKI